VDKLLLFLWNRKKIIVISLSAIFIWSIVYAFFLAKVEYCSEAMFLPPKDGSAGAVSFMGFAVPSLAGGVVLNEQIEFIFNSTAIKRRIIDQFNFYEIFKLTKVKAKEGKFENALKALKKYVTFEATEKGSMGFEKIVSYKISCYHRDPDSAKLLCDFAFSLLDSSVRELSINRARRNRIFVEEQLSLHKKALDSLQKLFTDFQVFNKAFVIPEQVKLTLKNYADIKSAAILNELRMKALEREFHGALPELEELQKNNILYNQKLSQIETDATPDVLPSLGLSAKLLPQYENLTRETEVENQVILLLSRELEENRLQEAKNISSLIMVDAPYVPTFKARPKRLFVLAMTFISLSLVLFLLLGYQFYFSTVLMNNEKVRSFLQIIKSSKR
jgi:capsule polysaccharide export protein KpsE/RkpR